MITETQLGMVTNMELERRRKRRIRPASIGKAISLALYFLFAALPIYWIVITSLKPESEIFQSLQLIPQHPTFHNFEDVWKNTNFPTFFRNSVIVSLSTGVICTILALLGGYALSRYTFRGKRLVLFLFLMTQMFPIVLLITPLYRTFVALHLLNSVWCLILTYTAFNTPFSAVLMQGFYESIPIELEEAAHVDGCNRITALIRIVAPLMKSGIVATAGFVFTAAWSELLFATMFIHDPNAQTLAVGLTTFIQKYNVAWGDMMAAAVITLIPVIIFFSVIQRYLVQGLTSGAVKG